MFFQQADAQFERLYESWRWAHFTTTSGLPSNIVDDIVETDNGTVWASTVFGIAWFDGFRWNKVMQFNGLPEKHPTQIFKGLKNTLLVVIDGNLFIGDTNTFETIKLKEPLNGNVSSVSILDSNSIVISTTNIQYPFVVYRDGKFNYISLFAMGRLYGVRNRETFLANTDGLFNLTTGQGKNILDRCFVRTIAGNKKGDVVMSVDSPNNMIGIWEWKKDGVPRWSISDRLLPIRSLDISSAGNVIAVYETGTIRIRENQKWKSLIPIPQQMSGVIFVKYDAHDNLWVGTEQGLYYFKNSPSKWTWWRHEFNDARNIVMDIIKNKNGDIWIGNNEGIEIHRKNGSAAQITHINNHRIGLVTGINEDTQGNMWIAGGSSFTGSYMWNETKWKHYGFKEGLESPRVHKIKKDRNGKLWFLGLGANGSNDGGMRKDPGAFLYDGQHFVRYTVDSGLIHNRVYSFTETENGSMWFGTKIGLSRKSSKGWDNFDNTKIKNLRTIYAIDSDKHGNLWFSNFTAQLGYIDQKDSVHWIWNWVSGTDYRQIVWDIKVDHKGIVWVATTRGLFSFYNGSWSSYDYESDYKLKELRVVLPLDDKIYVGGHGIGVGILNRNDIGFPIKINFMDPVVELDKTLLRWNVDAFWGAMPSDNIEVRYRLDSDKWSEWGTLREIVYSKLTSGRHLFEMQAKDIYGNLKVEKATAIFIVPPPFYKNILFLMIVIPLIVTIILLGYKNIRDSIRHAHIVQNQRIRIANDLHDEVGSNLGSIALISQRVGRSKSATKRMQEELSIISDTAIQTAEYLRDIVWYINPRYDNIVNLQARLREIAARMLIDTEIHFHVNDAVGNDERLVDIRRNILFMFKEILHNIIKHSAATKVDIYFDRKADSFQLLVRDNGIGFEQSSEHYGNGIRSLNKRAEEIGALLEIKTQTGKGTAISIIFANNVNI